MAKNIEHEQYVTSVDGCVLFCSYSTAVGLMNGQMGRECILCPLGLWAVVLKRNVCTWIQKASGLRLIAMPSWKEPSVTITTNVRQHPAI